MASFNITGFLKQKGETTKVSEKFTKRDFVIDYDLDQQYPQIMALQLAQDKCSLLDNLEVGQELKISFSIQSREYSKDGVNKTYFNTINAWRLEPTGNKLNYAQPTPMPEQTTQPTLQEQKNPLATTNNEIEDDLPF